MCSNFSYEDDDASYESISILAGSARPMVAVVDKWLLDAKSLKESRNTTDIAEAIQVYDNHF